MLELILGGMVGFLIALVPCMMLIPQKNQIAVRDMLFRRPHGVVNIFTKAGDVVSYIEDLSKTTTENGPKDELRSYVIREEGIVGENERITNKKKDHIYKKNGVKCIFFNELDASPVDVSKCTTKEEIKTAFLKAKKGKTLTMNKLSVVDMDSGMLNAIFMKMKTVAEINALKNVTEEIKKQSMMQIVIIVLIILSLAIAFGGFDKITNFVEPSLTAIRTKLGV